MRPTDYQINFSSIHFRFDNPLATVLLTMALASPALAIKETDLPRLQKRAAMGYVQDEISLAAAYLKGDGVPQDMQLAAHWYEQAAGQGDPDAQNMTGYLYEAGVGVARDTARAVHWFQLAAAAGLPIAQVNLAVSYAFGNGVSRNSEIAIRFLEEAAKKKEGIAGTYLGLIYYLGLGVPKDVQSAEKWLDLGLKLHDPSAAFAVGLLYFTQPDHPHDMKKASALLRQAADQGHVPAQYSLGLLLLRHPEQALSENEAKSMLESSANQGYWKSSMLLGVIQRDGRGVPVDLVAAYYHFSIASLQGRGLAEQMLKADLQLLRTRIPVAEITTATSAAESWFAQHPIAASFVYKDSQQDKRFPIAAVVAPSESIMNGVLAPSLAQ